MLEISPSYLNQIEHDVRPLTVAVLLRITEVFGVDATFFASQDDTRLVAELREVTMDRDLEHRRRPGGDRRHRQRPSRRWPGRWSTCTGATGSPPRSWRPPPRTGSPTAAAAARSRCRTRKCATTSTNGRTTCTSSTPPPRTSPSGCGCTAPTWPATSPTGSGRARRAHRQAYGPRRHRAAPLRPDDQDAGDRQPPVVGSAGVQDGRRTGLPRVRRPDRPAGRRRASSPATSRRTLARLGLANYFAAATVLPYRSFTTSPRTSATTSSGSRRSTR